LAAEGEFFEKLSLAADGGDAQVGAAEMEKSGMEEKIAELRSERRR